MATHQPSEAQRFVFSVRNVVGRQDSKVNFINDAVAKAKEMQRVAQPQYEAHLATLFKALDLYQLTGGSPSEMMCALATSELLLQLPLSSAQVSQCNSSIRVCLLSSNDVTTIVEAARVLGLSVGASGPNDFVRKALDDAMIWIGLVDARSEARRMGGLAVIDEVLKRVPVLFLKFLSDFFERIWGPLSDPNQDIKDFAIHVFDQSMSLLNTREADARLLIYSVIRNKIRTMLQSKNPEHNVGALSVFESFVNGAPNGNVGPQGSYEELVTMLSPVIQSAATTTSNTKVRQLLFHAYAVLCRCNPAAFSARDLKNAVNYGLDNARKDGVERPFAFRMLSDIITLVGAQAFRVYQDQTILAIKQVILNQKRQQRPMVWESLKCLVTICKVIPSREVEAHVQSTIEHVFTYGLSTQLIECMREIVASSSSEARLKLEESMLDIISITLSGLPFRQPAIKPGGSGATGSNTTEVPPTPAEPTAEQIVIALDAFLKFGFSNSEQLGDFLRDSVLPFVDNDKQEIRIAAIRTISSLLLPSTTITLEGTRTVVAVEEELTFSRRTCLDLVLTRLLVVGTSDNDPDIRNLVFSSLKRARYFKYLCEPQFLMQVCIALGDESPQCCLSVVELLCGMLASNPSYILPLLRREMVRVLQTIQSTARPHIVEQSLLVLARIAQGAPLFVRTFYHNVTTAIVPLFETITIRETHLQALLECLVAVSHANMFSRNHKDGDALKFVFSKLIGKSLELLRSLPVDKPVLPIRLLCVQLLVGLLRPSFDGASPYKHFPTLYHTLSSIVRNKDETTECRIEALRCFGKIGALDPHQFAKMEISEGISTSQATGIRSLGEINEVECTAIVLDALSNVLTPRNARVISGGSEPILRAALKTTLMLCERSNHIVNREIAVLFPSFCELILDLPKQSRIFFTAIHELCNLVCTAGETSLKSLNSREAFHSLIIGGWEVPKARFLLIQLSSLMIELASREDDAQRNLTVASHLGKFVPRILDEMILSDSLAYHTAVLRFLLNHAVLLQSLTQRVCQTLLEVLTAPRFSIEHSSQVIVVLGQIVTVSASSEIVSPMIRSCLAKLSTFVSTTVPVPSETNPFVVRTLGLLRLIASNKYVEFIPFASEVLRALKTLRLPNQELTFICTQACRGAMVCPPLLSGRSRTDMVAFVQDLQDNVFSRSYVDALAEVGEIWGDNAKQLSLLPESIELATPKAADVMLPIGESAIIERAQKISTLQTKDDWLRWYDELCKVIVAEAPYQVFRCISASQGVNSPSLVDRSTELVQDIVNVAFRCIHTNGSAKLRTVMSDVVSTLSAVGGQVIPDDVVAGILSIAEYMDMCGFALQVPHSQLADLAQNKGMLAKSLHWQEQAYRYHPADSRQALITTYASLSHIDSATGLLRSIKQVPPSPVVANVAPIPTVTTRAVSAPSAAHSRTESSISGSPHTLDPRLLSAGGGGSESGSIVSGAPDGGNDNNQNHPYHQQQMLMRLGKFEEALSLMNRHTGLSSSSFVQLSVDDSIFRSSIVTSSPTPHRSRHARTRSYSTVSDTDTSFTGSQDVELARHIEMEAGKIWCLSEVGDMHSALREWRRLLPHLKSFNKPINTDDDETTIQNMIAPFVADAAVRLQSWEDLTDALTWVPKDSVTYGVSMAASHIARSNFIAAQKSVDEARVLLLEEITGLLHESYARAYDNIVTAQLLVEFEEVISTLALPAAQNQEQQREDISSIWTERICNSAHSVATWKRILGPRGLLIRPDNDVSTRILFVKLCREYGGSRHLERFTLEQLLGSCSPSYDQLVDPTSNPRVVFEYITHLSSCSELDRYVTFGNESEILAKLIEIHDVSPDNKPLIARMQARRGYCSEPAKAVEYYEQAVTCDPRWFRGWRFWAEANVAFLEANPTSEPHLSSAIQGFVKAIELAPTTSNKLQDVLKFLSLWSKHGDTPVGLAKLEQNVFEISLAVWQLVIPQLIARLDSGSDASVALVAKVISAVAMHHPQSLIYPLNVCTASNVERRRVWASSILSMMENKFPQLVDQGKMVTAELIRLSGLIYEQWHETLESAANAFFGRRDYVEMLELVIPQHEKLNRRPETLVEVEFYAKYHRQLEEARHWVRSFSLTGKVADLHCAWHNYHYIYKQIDEQLKAGSKLDMQFCSPRLWEARNLALAIPDARPKEGKDTVRIAAFDTKLTVIASKQRPKRIAFQGTDGVAHKFLLKGHEDLRLDERVMQLFKLVNTLLLANPHTSKVAGFQIQRYSVTPLWDTVGLIGWVDECDTIHELIHSYRKQRSIVPELELKVMHNVLPTEHPKAYDLLPVMSKVEVLEYLWDHTSGHDMRNAMWASSLTCETWLERRRTFTTSLATMSVVGYILGLGDRHPNNIMIQRSSGRVVHIDFGDCFEVAMTRDRFPERVPFRLTRMLQNAMEVNGVDGNFRASAETVMTALRDNKDSLIALLAAFVQDPLISWRLVKQKGDDLLSDGDNNKKIEEELEVAVNEQNSEDAGPLMMLMPFSEDDDIAALEATRRQRQDKEILEEDRKANEAQLAHQGVAVLSRLASKLRGQEFGSRRKAQRSLDPKSQVSRLITEATEISNIAQSWSGWYPFW